METSMERKMIIDEATCNRLVKKNIVLLLMGHLVSLFGSSIYSFAISLYILQLTGSGLNFAMTMILSTLPRIILGPIAGVVSDRVNRKKMVVIMDILSGVVVLGLFSLSVVDELRLGYIYGTTVLLSVCSTFFATPFMASIPNLVDDKNITRINSLNQSIASIATIAGPFIGGLIFVAMPMGLFLLINGLSFVFSGISEMFIDFNAREKIYGVSTEESQNKAKPKKSFKGDMIEGLKYIKTQKWLVVLGSFVVFFNFFIAIGMTIPIPYIANVVWEFSETQYGMLNTAFPLGMLVASVVLSMLPETKSNYKRIIGGLGAFATMILSMGILTSEKLFVLENWMYLIILMIMYMIIAISAVLINVPVSVSMQKHVPNDKLGRVNGVFTTLAQGLNPIGVAIAGVLVDFVPAWILPLSCGIILIMLTIYMSTVKELKGL